MRFPSLIAAFDNAFYPGVPGHWDDWAFRDMILPHLSPDTVVLDVGAGAGIVEAMDFRGQAKRIIGIDPDPRVLSNPNLDEAHQGFADEMPFLADGSVDLAFSDNVLEHVENPLAFLSEIRRVVRPGGILLTKTPNRRHYMPLIARLTPHSFHRAINRVRGRADVDTFPTRYRLNTRRDQARWATASGWQVEETHLLESRPEYLRISALTYPFGIAYERMVNAFGMDSFKILQMTIFRRT